MRVSEVFESEKIDQEFLVNQADESDYWAKCASFVIDNWSEDVEGLSSKQAAWLTKILEDCVEIRIERRQTRSI